MTNNLTTALFIVNDVSFHLTEESKRECERYGLPFPNGIGDIIGIIPTFFSADQAHQSFDEWKSEVEGNYGYPVSELGGTVEENGVYKYPEDPDLLPLVVAKVSPYKSVCIYTHGIVSMRSNGETFVCRMD